MYRGPIAELDEQQILEVFHTNVVAGMMLTQAALDHLVASRGAVMFIGSTHSQRAFPGVSPYAATKGAVETLTGVLAAELGPHRHPRVVRPARRRVHRDQPARRAGRRRDALASASSRWRRRTRSAASARSRRSPRRIEYLARAEWVTGGVLTVDGGLCLGVTNE